MHILESLVDAAQILPVRDELVDLQLLVQVVLNKTTHLRAALDTAERAAFPPSTCDELERYTTMSARSRSVM